MMLRTRDEFGHGVGTSHSALLTYEVGTMRLRLISAESRPPAAFGVKHFLSNKTNGINGHANGSLIDNLIIPSV
jgi:hypothetical protein